MKGLVGIILGIVMLLAGCGRSVDSRLALADSLIDEQADSAYMMLKGVNAGELTHNSDRAYYALLYTQAQYKNMDSIASDSLINIAVDYYADNHNRELYTRALIYKGAVMQELGKEQEAMEWYKRAEDNASPDDYMNLGQANLRMSVLYALNYADNDETLEKERRALRYFRKAGSKSYELMCLSSIGGGYRQCNMDSAYYYLHQAITLAKELKDDNRLYLSTEMLARAYNEDSLYTESKALSLDYLANNGTDHIDDDIYYDLAYSYAKIGMADSAQFYFDKTSEHPQEDSKIVMRIFVSEIISVLKQDMNRAYFLIKEKEDRASNILSDRENRIEKAENLYEQNSLKNDVGKLEKKVAIQYILFVLLIAIIIYVGYTYKEEKNRVNYYKKLASQLKDEKRSIICAEKSVDNMRIQQLSKSYITIIKELKDCVDNYEHNSKLFKTKIRNIDKIIKNNNNELGEELMSFVDKHYNDFITKLKQEYSVLSFDDLRIVAMICCNFSYIDMSICLGYAHKNSIYKRKEAIAKKMDISMSIDEFISKKIDQNRVD